MGKKIVCFGEVLLRMSPQANGQWLAQQMMPVYTGGAELNVAVALAKWQVPVAYCTAMPPHALSGDIIQYLNKKGIDTSAVLSCGNRLGVYYLPQGTDLKHAGVIYDRAGSSFAGLQPGTIDWDSVLADVSWFHFSAISPALNENVAAVCEEGLQAAAAKGITISLDLNYRSKLWQYGKQPADVMIPLAGYCQVLMGNVWAADTLLGIPADKNIHADGGKEAYLSHALQTCIALQQRFPKLTHIANSFRFDDGEEGIRYFASLYHNGEQVSSPEFFTRSIQDRVGTGDCFMAGLIYGLHQHHTLQQKVDFAASAAYGKFFEAGDGTQQTVEEIQKRLLAINGEN